MKSSVSRSLALFFLTVGVCILEWGFSARRESAALARQDKIGNAFALSSDSKYAEAIAIFEKVARETPDAQERGMLKVEIAQTHREWGEKLGRDDRAAAVAHHRLALSLEQRTGDRSSEVWARTIKEELRPPWWSGQRIAGVLIPAGEWLTEVSAWLPGGLLPLLFGFGGLAALVSWKRGGPAAAWFVGGGGLGSGLFAGMTAGWAWLTCGGFFSIGDSLTVPVVLWALVLAGLAVVLAVRLSTAREDAAARAESGRSWSFLRGTLVATWVVLLARELLSVGALVIRLGFKGLLLERLPGIGSVVPVPLFVLLLWAGGLVAFALFAGKLPSPVRSASWRASGLAGAAYVFIRRQRLEGSPSSRLAAVGWALTLVNLSALSTLTLPYYALFPSGCFY